MIISLKRKFAFLCMPKCASTSTEKALRRLADIRIGGLPSMKHLNYRGYEKYVVPLIEEAGVERDEMKVYCMVRDPVSWLKSWWRFRQRDALKDPSHKRHQNYTAHLTFEEFFEMWETDLDRPANVGTQRRFLMDNEGNVPDINIYRYEDIGSLIAAMESDAGRKLEMGSLNQSPSKEAGQLEIDLNRPRIKSEYDLYNSI